MRRWLIWLLVATPAAADEVHRCVGPDGAVMWTTEPCPPGQETTRKLPVQVSREARPAPPAYPARAEPATAASTAMAPVAPASAATPPRSPTRCEAARAKCEAAKAERDEWLRNRSLKDRGAPPREWNSWVREQCQDFGPRC